MPMKCWKLYFYRLNHRGRGGDEGREAVVPGGGVPPGGGGVVADVIGDIHICSGGSRSNMRYPKRAAPLLEVALLPTRFLVVFFLESNDICCYVIRVVQVHVAHHSLTCCLWRLAPIYGLHTIKNWYSKCTMQKLSFWSFGVHFKTIRAVIPVLYYCISAPTWLAALGSVFSSS